MRFVPDKGGGQPVYVTPLYVLRVRGGLLTEGHPDTTSTMNDLAIAPGGQEKQIGSAPSQVILCLELIGQSSSSGARHVARRTQNGHTVGDAPLYLRFAKNTSCRAPEHERCLFEIDATYGWLVKTAESR